MFFALASPGQNMMSPLFLILFCPTPGETTNKKNTEKNVLVNLLFIGCFIIMLNFANKIKKKRMQWVKIDFFITRNTFYCHHSYTIKGSPLTGFLIIVAINIKYLFINSSDKNFFWFAMGNQFSFF